MTGTVWKFAGTAIGVGVVIFGAVGRAVPNSPATSTQSAGAILRQISPFVGLFLFIAGIATMLSLTLKI